MTNLRIDVPRHSWSPEFYSISCSQASMVHPATTSYVEQLKPCMTQCALSSLGHTYLLPASLCSLYCVLSSLV